MKEIVTFQKQLRKQFAAAQAAAGRAIRLRSIRRLWVPRAISQPRLSRGAGYKRTRWVWGGANKNSLRGLIWKTPSFSPKRRKTARRQAASSTRPAQAPKRGGKGIPRNSSVGQLGTNPGLLPAPRSTRSAPSPPASLGSIGHFRCPSRPKGVLKEMQIF